MPLLFRFAGAVAHDAAIDAWLRPGGAVDDHALCRLVAAAFDDVVTKSAKEAAGGATA